MKGTRKRTPEGILDGIPGGILDGLPGGIIDGTCLRISEKVPGTIPDGTSKGILNKLSDEFQKELSGNSRRYS